MRITTTPTSQLSPAPDSAQAARRTRQLALSCALIYALFAALWILVSAKLAGHGTQQELLWMGLGEADGLPLAAVTTALVYAAALYAGRRLSRHEATARQREMLLSGIVETAMDAIITVDVNQTIVVFNRAAGEVFRLPAEQAIGQPLDRFIPARAHAVHRHHVRAFANTGQTSRRMGHLHTLVGVRADGEEFPMEASLSRLSEGDKVLMTVVLRDATERFAAQKAHEAQQVAEAASQAKTQFLARMSHELRTPLNAILGFSHIVLANSAEPLGEEKARQVEHIRNAGWHLLSLVNDVLDVSRIESGDMQLEFRSVDVRRELDEAWLLIGKDALRHGVELDAAYRDAPAAGAWCDPLRLRQVLVNILSNAVKYNRAGGHVRIELETDATQVRIVFTDSGLGMTHEQLAHLYEPFNRLGRERGGVSGTGIGLSLTRDLVLMMKGKLNVDSVPGEGTRVELALPSCPAPHSTTPATSPLPAPSSAHSPAPPSTVAAEAPAPTVLYIEDNPVNMLVIEQLFARWPVACLAKAEDGASGLAAARRLQPDLILLDMRLPDMTGIDVLAALRADPATAALRVVALSASAMPGDADQACRAGAIAYWTKPLQFDQFLRDVQRLLGRHTELV